MNTPGRCALIADEVTAAGFRLAGVECHVPPRLQVPALFEQLRADAGLLMITAELSAALPQAVLADALARQRPPVLVLSDIRGRVPAPDAAAALRRQLGLAE